MTTLKELEHKALHAIQYGNTIRPTRDWLVLLSITGVLILLSALWNAWTFVRVQNGEAVGLPSPSEQTVSSNAIEDAKALFEARAAEEARYGSEYSFVDPS